MTRSKIKNKIISSKSVKKMPTVLLIEILSGTFLSFLSLLSFLFLTNIILKTNGISLDTQISNHIYSFRTPFLTGIMMTLSYIGNEIILTLSICIFFILLIKNYKNEAKFFFFTITLGFVLNLFLKYLFKIPRPTIDPIYQESFYSFPSGHAMNSFIFLATSTYLIYHFTKNTFLTFVSSVIAITLILLIGLSRVYLGVHYPSDVIAGFIAGFCWFVTMIVIHKTHQFLTREKK